MCASDVQYCGYGSEVWDIVADKLGLYEGHDWVRVCTGGSAFYETVQDMSEYDRTGSYRPALCDFTASGMIASEERYLELGLQFTRAIARSSVGALVQSNVKLRGRWEFLKPLDVRVWIAIVAMAAAVPIVVVGYELLLRKHSHYLEAGRPPGGRNVRASIRHHVLLAYLEGLWECMGQLLQTHFVQVKTPPARLVGAAFAFATLVLSNTYLANLSAWLTTDRLDGRVDVIKQLWNKKVGTYPVYQESLLMSYGLETFSVPAVGENWDQDVADNILQGKYYGAILDRSTALGIIAKEGSCQLRLLEDTLDLSDTVFAFKRTFGNETLMHAVDTVLLQMQEDGTMSMLYSKHNDFKSPCQAEIDVDPARPVPLHPLSGLWLMYGGCVAFAMALSAGKILYAQMWPESRTSRELSLRWKMIMSAVRNAACRRGRQPPATTSQTAGAAEWGESRASNTIWYFGCRDKMIRCQILLEDLLSMMSRLENYQDMHKWEGRGSP